MKDVFVLLATNEYLTVRYQPSKLEARGLLKLSWRDRETVFFITPTSSTVLREARYAEPIVGAPRTRRVESFLTNPLSGFLKRTIQ